MTTSSGPLQAVNQQLWGSNGQFGGQAAASEGGAPSSASSVLLGKLSTEERQRIRYGVRRKGADGQHVFVPHVFSNVRRRGNHTAGNGEAHKDGALLPIAEIVEIFQAPSP